MGKLTPIEQAKMLEYEYRDYVKSTFTLDDETYNDKFNKELDNVQLVKGPYLNKMLPFLSGETIKELCADGTLNNDFVKLGEININRSLYLHQIEALNKIANGRSIVVTTGTGSGKTESYLYPIINYIMNSKDIDEPGVRAIFLFPMNALVNDQMKRIRKLLATYPKIKFGRYVGDTKDHINPKDERKRLSVAYNCDIPENELVTREEIRENPPHLLFTNYSMLEYLLLRPKDRDILSPEKANKWQFIVLDEAHTYNGALGIEVGMLLRRLTEKIQKKPQFILTSATLGEQGKSEDEIISFATSLTSAHYTYDDIIFSKRKRFVCDELYMIEGADYSKIKENLDDAACVLKILSKYCDVTGLEKTEALLKTFKGDINVKHLDRILNKSELFSTVYDYFKDEMNEKNLSDFVYLVSYIYSDTRELFDIKYHTFIRTVDGCFVTLNDSKDLSLQRCLMIDDFKTFEIGKCKKCSNVYIIGKIEGGFLKQNTDLDIYENIEEGETIPVDYFAINDDISEFDIDFLENYKLCTKCGKIHKANETNPSFCNCGEEYLKDIYKVKKDDSNVKARSNILFNNNITYCPCCKKSSNSGIVSSFYLGKDATTAVLTQIVMKAIDKKEDVKQVMVKNPFESPFVIKPKKVYTKQLLEFSDGRQQASFAASFCNYNHERFLRKKLLFDVCENETAPIKFNELRSKLENRINKYNLFDNEYSADESDGDNKNAWITILNELLNIDGTNGAEGLGIYAFQADLQCIKDFEQYLNDYFKNKNIDLTLEYDELYQLLNIIINFFRNVPAIDYDSSNLTIDEKKNEFSYRMFDNYVILNKDLGSKIINAKGNDISKNVRSLLPVNSNQTNKLVDYVMAITNYDKEHASDFIETCFELLVNTKLIKSENEDQTSIDSIFKVPANNFVLIGPKIAHWYQCKKCKSLTLYNVKGICPSCSSKALVECDPNVVFKDNYYRKEYMTKKVERLVFREHTGQLQAQEASKIQQEFQDKKINMLSCSTTFEMGVDIGTLETVFMRNVPPTPANYVQRAGRAGRGEDSSAFVLTFCGTSSHDYTYFLNPEKMIAGNINPPLFQISNKKIVLRHIIDTALSFYLKLHEEDFDNIGRFMEHYGMFENYIKSKSDDKLNAFINHFITDTGLSEYLNWGWVDAAIGSDGILKNYKIDFDAYAKEMNDLALEAFKAGDMKTGGYYKSEIKQKNEESFIDALASNNIIPKYGFPVDTVKLSIAQQNAKVDLTRDLQIALSEYAPGSEVIAEGKKYTSRYVALPRGKDITKYYYFKCPNCNKINYSVNPNGLEKCKECEASNLIINKTSQYFIIPKKGFIAESKISQSKMIKPKKTYSNDIQYLGEGIFDTEIKYKEKAVLVSNKNDKLIVLNENPFYMCNKCGYTVIDKEARSMNAWTITKKHKFVFGDCHETKLERMSLGYIFRTDVIKMKFEAHFEFHQIISFMYALLDGISEAFTIDRNDISGVISTESDGKYSIVIYDDIPGGAGHVKRLLNMKKFEEALKLSKNKISNCTCDIKTSCYNCLRNYKNQAHHRNLTRKGAIDVFDYLL